MPQSDGRGIARFFRALFANTGQKSTVQYSAGRTRAGLAARSPVVARLATSRLGRPSQGVMPCMPPGEETELGDLDSTRTR